MTFAEWWADDSHFIPRIWRDFKLDRVGLYTLAYDEPGDVYRMDYVHIPKKDLPAKAVHLTGSGQREWLHDTIDLDGWPKPGECNAIDLYLYMKSSAMDDALTVQKKLPFYIDTRMLIIAGAAVVGCIVLWMVLK